MPMQNTMFDTVLSSAADKFKEAVQEIERAKNAKQLAETELLHEMKRLSMTELDLGDNIIVRYKFIDEQEKLTVHKVKPKGERYGGHS